MSSNVRRKPSRRNKGMIHFQPLPDLSPEEFEVLKADIAENGLRYPVIEDENGKTIDGHQRLRALAELKIKNYPVTVMAGLTDDEKWEFAISVNAKRRHLSSKQKRELVAQELRRTPERANNWLADMIGVDCKTVQSTRRRLESTLEIPKLEKLEGKDGRKRTTRYNCIISNTPRERAIARTIVSDLPGDANKVLDATTAQRRAKRNAWQIENADEPIPKSNKRGIRLFHCRFQDLMKTARLRPNSVNLIATDIPYGAEFLPEIAELSEFAANVLVEGGIFLTYSGQYHLPKVLSGFEKHLQYRWTMALVWNDDANRIRPLRLMSKWKPVLVFSKGKWQNQIPWCDVLTVAKKEKSDHEWQQGLHGVESLVNAFSNPGDLVCDPLAGAFTTAVACYRTGRKFVGSDVNEKCLSIGRQRLADQ